MVPAPKSREELILENIEIEKLALKYKKALHELVQLKAMKDNDGFKSTEYQKRQPLAWDNALKVLLDTVPDEQMSLSDLRKANIKRGIEWNKGVILINTEELLFRSNELGGEVGEAQNKIKKLVRHIKGWVGGVTFDEAKTQVAKELGDVVICVDRVAEALDLDLAKCTKDKFNETSDKHGFNTKL